ncbi:hypothetical protein O9G_000792 [Rozella allomycis CSF55]|uniref:Uncharacterized protein n=1 Tax=Rozella allomycis (strain CSF55) TaxID=988480 RepID=A0A075AVI6_ROZAC|nr:hypothetical protein O9G_000792 [Rozella allomycis CSF55]|eukprot:EPZ32717.1 hypothetical protein O9G_000792 [Rozella allomycis CSF55]
MFNEYKPKLGLLIPTLKYIVRSEVVAAKVIKIIHSPTNNIIIIPFILNLARFYRLFPWSFQLYVQKVSLYAVGEKIIGAANAMEPYVK